ncbi:MAG TPA: ABC transporter substrate-binding protein [Candidatus Dormibacteraeota bacterium]
MKSRFLGLVGAVVMVAAACGGSGGGTAANSPSSSVPFNVISVAGISGSTGALAASFHFGMQSAAIVLNQQGGILGHKIKITTYDTGGSATNGVSLLTQQLTSTPPDGGTWNFCQCGGSSDEALAENPIAGQYKVISVTNTGATQLQDPKQFPYHFNNSTDARLTAKYLVADVQKMSFKKLALFTSDAAYGQTENQQIGAQLKAANIPYINLTFSATAVDDSPALLQLQSQGVDLIIWSGLGANIGTVLKDRKKIGWNVPMVGDLGVSSSDDLALVGGDKSALTGTSIFAFTADVAGSSISSTASFKNFADTLQTVAPVITGPLHNYLSGWDALQLMKLAATQAGSLDNDKMKAALENLTVPSSAQLLLSPSGFGWTSASHAPVNPADEFEIVSVGPLVNGQFVPPTS